MYPGQRVDAVAGLAGNIFEVPEAATKALVSLEIGRESLVFVGAFLTPMFRILPPFPFFFFV